MGLACGGWGLRADSPLLHVAKAFDGVGLRTGGYYSLHSGGKHAPKWPNVLYFTLRSSTITRTACHSIFKPLLFRH